MKIKNRIFISNTLMVLASLVIFLAINGALVNLFQEEYINVEISKAKVDENVFEIQSLFEQSTDSLLDYETFSTILSEYDYQLCIIVDEDIIYSNLSRDANEMKNYIKSIDLSGEHAKVYSWAFITAVGKSFEVENHEYTIVAVHSTNKNTWFDEKRSQFKAFILDFILIGFATILVLIGISQLFTNRLVKRIMKPVDKLMDAAKRIEEGNLVETIVYKGYDEFETVCTSFNQMQRHLFEEQKQIASYEKARTDMVSGISHDLRTPLTSVKGYIKGLKDGIAVTPEKQMQYLDIAYGKACEMDVLLQRLFYFSKMETGNMPFYKKKVDLNEFIRNFIERCKNDLETKGASIFFDISTDKHMAFIDIEQMQRVLTNLVENSLKYANTDFLKINISLLQLGNQEVIEISDNGSGVDSDKLPHLFEQFYRGDESRSTKNSEGNGIGLYIAKYIVEAHDGTIKAENDNGFKIIITLPKERSGA